METQVVWSNRASVNLQNIYNYIANDSEVYANRFIKLLITSVVESSLKTFPLSGRLVPEFQDTHLNFLKEVIYKGYRIIYNPTKFPQSITVIAVIKGRMDILRTVKSSWVID